MQGLKVLQSETNGISKGREGRIWETVLSNAFATDLTGLHECPQARYKALCISKI